MTHDGFPTRLKQILTVEGRTQAWLARQIGLDRSRISQWANGVLTPGHDNQAKIARTLGREIADVFPACDVQRSPHTPQKNGRAR